MPDETEVEIESTEFVDTLETTDTEVIEEPGDLYVIKVDGEEQEVSLEELRNGYQRQADYTRKTQEISAERDRLQQAESIVAALENNPEETLQILAKSFNVGAPVNVADSTDWEELDPTEQKIAVLEKKIEAQEASQRQQVIERQVVQLQEQHGDFDRREFLNHALKNNISNLDAAYAHWRFNDVKSTADKLQQEKDITSKKRDASIVSTGSSTQTGTKPAPEGKAATIREAFAMAKKQLST